MVCMVRLMMCLILNESSLKVIGLKGLKKVG